MNFRCERRRLLRLLAPVWGLDAAIVEEANAHRSYDVCPVNSETLAEQQKIADAFFAEGLLPRKQGIAATLWRPAP